MSFKQKAAIGGSIGVLALAVPFVGGWEGLRTEAYLDPVNIPTICYGSTQGVKIGDTKTKEQCDALLTKELLTYLKVVNENVKVPLPDTRRAALTSFIYNVGAANFERSTLLRKLNKGDTRGACNELTKWVFAKGRFLKGLLRRRNAEKELCLKGLDDDI